MNIMVENKTDRRVRRTKRLLLESLTSLMKEKPIKDISVKELTDLADINRGTFYLHYRDIYDMLEQLEDEWFADFNELLDKTPPAPDSTGSVARLSENMFQFLLDNKDIADALLGPNGDLTFINRLKDLLRRRTYSLWKLRFRDTLYFEYYFSFIVSGYIGLIQTWRLNGWEPSAHELSLMADQLLGARERS